MNILQKQFKNKHKHHLKNINLHKLYEKFMFFFRRSCLFIKTNIICSSCLCKNMCSVFVFCFFWYCLKGFFNDFCIFYFVIFWCIFWYSFLYICPKKWQKNKNTKIINKNKQIIKKPLTKHIFYINICFNVFLWTNFFLKKQHKIWTISM